MSDPNKVSLPLGAGAPQADAIKGVRSKHPDYARMYARWQRCRHVAAGRDAVHEAGELYLPKLKSQDADCYRAYVRRAGFFNATWRTIAGMAGMLLAKPPQKDLPAGVTPLLDDITLSGVPLDGIVQKLTEEALTVGRVCLLVDYQAISPDNLPKTIAEAEAQRLRPSLQLYRAEDFYNWKTGRVGNRTVLTQVRLEETFKLPTNDEFAEPTEQRYRVLDLLNGVYRQRVYRVNDKGQDEQVGDDVVPLMNGKALTAIPFFIMGTDDVTPDVDVPPLIDLVDVNLDHYRVKADYENVCHMSGVPTPYVTGYMPKTGESEMTLGSTELLVFPDATTRVGFLELAGSSVPCLENNLASKKEEMAVLGARLLAGDPSATETATTAAIHRAGENSVLASTATVLSLGMKMALDVFCAWAGYPANVKYAMNTDFLLMGMDPAMLQAQVAAYQSGVMSFDTLFANMQRGGLQADANTAEDEKAKIAAAPPTIPGLDSLPPAANSNPAQAAA